LAIWEPAGIFRAAAAYTKKTFLAIISSRIGREQATSSSAIWASKQNPDYFAVQIMTMCSAAGFARDVQPLR